VGDHQAGHDIGERLYVPGATIVHRLPAHLKLLAAVTTILVVVATPPTWLWAFAGYAALAVALVATAKLPLRVVVPRMVVEVPVLVFALLLPILGTGPRIAVGPLTLSQAGLWAGWGIIVKATFGVVTSIVLAATTSTNDMVAGLRRLRVPDQFVQIFAAMVRYVHVVGAEARRMNRARTARGFTAKGPRSWSVLGQSLGTLFIRSYERGERVHLAMLSRGYTGAMPTAPAAPDSRSQLMWAVSFPAVAAVVWLVVASGYR